MLDQLNAATAGLATEGFLRHLIEERFCAKTVVTASLRSSSVVVLKMVADIDPTTPVVFCRRGTPFPESLEYQETIVRLLGLSDVTVSDGHESHARRGDYDHCERMWVEYPNAPGRSFEIAHLNDALAAYECWISAVYHVKPPDAERHRLDVEGRLCRVDPLAGWSRDDVRTFMRLHGLPYHERAFRGRVRMEHRDDATPIETFNV